MFSTEELSTLPLFATVPVEKVARVAAAAVGEGSMVIAFIHQFLGS